MRHVAAIAAAILLPAAAAAQTSGVLATKRPHLIVRWIGPLLLLFGVILGVNQVALGLQLILGGVSGLIEHGAFAAPPR